MLLQDFTQIKLSYESFIHKKVLDADVILAIPEGQKCFAWFTTEKNKNVCYIMEIGGNKQIKKINVVNACFRSSLSYGTIFYGTLTFYDRMRFFAVEDVLYCKGKMVQNLHYIDKLHLLHALFLSDMEQVSYNKAFVVFGFPPMYRTTDVSTLEQKPMYYQYRYFHKPAILNIARDKYFYEPPIQNKPNRFIRENEREFKVTPDIQNDIYYLHSLDGSSTIGTAYIPDYKTSVMMNKLFRNIKENDKLDALEESESEEEFENDRIDKFVYLDREQIMVCAYNHKFKKWAPLRISSIKK